MKILIISNINGLYNEGMRNIATHIGRELSEIGHMVQFAGLRDFMRIFFLSLRADRILVCARAKINLYVLTLFLCFIGKRPCIILVQKPEISFLRIFKFNPLSVDVMFIQSTDATCIEGLDQCKIHRLYLGIESRFAPGFSDTAGREIRRRYGIPVDKRIVLHVGHCSTGRGLEDFLLLDGMIYQGLVVTSGLFEDAVLRKRLETCGIIVVNEYIPDIQLYYQAADVYFFPTKSSEYVISIPLSIMEALACGTPVIAYRSLEGIEDITATQGAIRWLEAPDQINVALTDAIAYKSEQSLLVETRDWKESAKTIEGVLKIQR